MKIPYLTRDGAGAAGPGTRFDRRHLLKFLGGSAVGAVLSPLPWKVLDDVSIWSQNWSWIPVPAKGPTITRHTTCALCPAGCGVKVRCIGAQPVALSGLPGHPTSQGFLCPGGLLGHHLPYAPHRVTQPLRATSGGTAVTRLSPEQVAAELGKILARLKTDSGSGRVAIMDSLPGRSTSIAYRQFLSQFPNGTYIAQGDDTRRALRVFDGTGTAAYPELGMDLERARTILSFGADFTGGWGTPGAVWKNPQSSDPGPRLIQIEPRYSNTAAMADSWLPVLPGREAFLALGLAGVILKERLFDSKISTLVGELGRMPEFRDLFNGFPPLRCAEASGISLDAMAATAREMSQAGPCLAVLGETAGGCSSEVNFVTVNLLNLLTGAVGREGGIVPRRRVPGSVCDGVSATDLCDLPDHSIAFLILDETVDRPSISSSLIQQKLIPDNAVVISLCSSGIGYSPLSTYVLPAPLYLETFQEIPPGQASPMASCSFSVPMLPAPPAVLPASEWVRRFAESAKLEWQGLSVEKQLESRAKAIWETRRGSVFSYAEGTDKPNSDFASAEDLTKAFIAGACWVDSPADPISLNLPASAYSKPQTWRKLKGLLDRPLQVSGPGDDELTLVPFTTGVVAGSSSPLAGKLTHESDLYPCAGDAFVSPSTASRLGVDEGQTAVLETTRGRLSIRVRTDETVRPGLVFVPMDGGSVVSTKADPRNVCEITDEGVWRATPAKLRRSDV